MTRMRELNRAYAVLRIPGARRASGVRVEFTGEEIVTTIRAFRAMAALAGPNS